MTKVTLNCGSKPCDFRKQNNECHHSTLKVNKSMTCVVPIEEGLSFMQKQIPCFHDEKLRTLITRKKLHLVLDLDNTLIHTVHIRELTKGDRKYLVHPIRLNWFKEGKLFMFDKEWLVKLRPYARAFLEGASTMFDFSIYTLGTNAYAKKVVEILDPKGLYFSPSNVFSQEDCTRPNIKRLDVVKHDERVVLVVDDTKQVWVDNPKNLIEIKPYEFFVEKGSRFSKKKYSSWLQWKGDESEKHGELARVLTDLKKIHNAFFDSKDDQIDYYESRDVRDVVEEVRRKFKFLKYRSN